MFCNCFDLLRLLNLQEYFEYAEQQIIHIENMRTSSKKVSVYTQTGECSIDAPQTQDMQGMQDIEDWDSWSDE